MKKLILSLVCVFVAVSLFGKTASAVPAFKKHFDATYVKDNDNADFVAAAKKAKCNVCHYSKKKKNRNDYGMALSKLLKKADFKASRIKEEPDAVKKELTEAFEKVAGMKSKGGETFGALIKAGKLPGTAPEEDAKAEDK